MRYKFNKIMLLNNSRIHILFRLLMPLLYGFLWVLLLSKYIGNIEFIDEYDNIIGGLVLASGKEMYTGYFSQHTPLLYYICFIFNLIGAKSLIEFRLYFYIFLVLIWMFIYYRYSKFFSKILFLIYPVVYIFSLHYIDPVAHTLISDQLTGLCMVILTLEVFRINATKTVKVSDLLVISISGFSAILATFIAIYPVFFGYLIVLYFTYKNCNGIRAFIGKASILLLFVVIPFLLLFLYMYIEGNLYEFYYQAYILNVKVYSKFQNGLGSDKLQALIGAGKLYFDPIFYGGSFEVGEFKKGIFFPLFMKFFVFLYLVILIKKDFFYCILFLFFIISLTMRGAHGFHALPYFAVAELIFCIIFCNALMFRKQLEYPLIIVIFLILASYGCQHYFYNIKNNTEISKTPGYKEYINTALFDNDKIFMTSLATDQLSVYVTTSHLPAISIASVVPWITEGNEDRFVSDLEIAKPKLVLHNGGNEVWGHKVSDYAPILNSYIYSHYTPLRAILPDIMIRNEYYIDIVNNAINKNPDLFSNEYLYPVVSNNENLGEFSSGSVLEQSIFPNNNNLSQLNFLMATYQKKCKGKLLVNILGDDDKVLRSGFIDLESLQDNAYAPFKFKPIIKSNNKSFKVQITSIDSPPDLSPTFWLSSDSSSTMGILYLNGIKMKSTLVIGFGFKRNVSVKN